jgi:hypothetical protein
MKKMRLVIYDNENDQIGGINGINFATIIINQNDENSRVWQLSAEKGLVFLEEKK